MAWDSGSLHDRRQENSRMRRMTSILLSAFLVAIQPTPGVGGDKKADFFEMKVRPLLVAKCYKCHGGTTSKGGLRLDSLAGLVKGGDSGPALVPGDPEKSLLIRAVR